jgi:hypothetical protein
MTTYTIQEDGLPTVEAHIVERTDSNNDEFAVLKFRYGKGHDSMTVEFFMSEAQLMQFSNTIVRAVANVRPPLADMDEEEECVLDDGEQEEAEALSIGTEQESKEAAG